MKNWVWLVAGFVGALALVVWYSLRGRRADARKAAVDMMHEWHRQDVAAKNVEIERLKKDFEGNRSKIAKVRKQLRDKKQSLSRKYEDSGLSTHEISERFNRLAL